MVAPGPLKIRMFFTPAMPAIQHQQIDQVLEGVSCLLMCASLCLVIPCDCSRVVTSTSFSAREAFSLLCSLKDSPVCLHRPVMSEPGPAAPVRMPAPLLAPRIC